MLACLPFFIFVALAPTVLSTPLPVAYDWENATLITRSFHSDSSCNNPHREIEIYILNSESYWCHWSTGTTAMVYNVTDNEIQSWTCGGNNCYTLDLHTSCTKSATASTIGDCVQLSATTYAEYTVVGPGEDVDVAAGELASIRFMDSCLKGNIFGGQLHGTVNTCLTRRRCYWDWYLTANVQGDLYDKYRCELQAQAASTWREVVREWIANGSLSSTTMPMGVLLLVLFFGLFGF